MEVICNRNASDEDLADASIPCSVRKCQDVVPVCRYVGKAYRKGDCQTAEIEPCLTAMRICSEVERLKSRYKEQLDEVCPQSAGGPNVRVRVEPSSPLEE